MTLACQGAGSIMPGTAHSLAAWGNGGVIITKRLSVVVALGALLGMFAGVLIASLALAGRDTNGSRRRRGPSPCIASARLLSGVTFPVNKECPKGHTGVFLPQPTQSGSGCPLWASACCGCWLRSAGAPAARILLLLRPASAAGSRSPSGMLSTRCPV